MIVKVSYNPDFDKKVKKAQFWLDSQVFNDCEPYMPLKSGSLKNSTRAENASLAGSGRVCIATAPYGRFQYYGKVMVDPETGSPWARKDAKKVLTDRDLTWSNPFTVPRWFETVKSIKEKEWKEGVEDILNGTSNL